MSRWVPDARGRLEAAALELFADRGFAQTTVPQITARAGLTTRTFFRHYADKREVLFKGEEEIPEAVAALMGQAPPGLAPMDLIAWGLHTMATTTFADQLTPMLQRRAVIETDDGLREREVHKQAAMAAAIADALRGRGLDELTATLAGKTAVAVFSTAFQRWLDAAGERSFDDVVAEAVEAQRGLADAPGPSGD